MKAPLSLLVGCLLVVLAALGYGAWERHVGAQQAAARAHADSLLQASEAESHRIALQDSIRSRVALDSLQRLNVEIETTKHLVSQARAKGDSIAKAVSGDSVVPRDSVAALVGAFQQERAAADSQIATLTTENTLLRGEISAKDSTIRALNTLLDGNRDQLRKALAPKSTGFLQRGAALVVQGLALYGAVRLVAGK